MPVRNTGISEDAVCWKVRRLDERGFVVVDKLNPVRSEYYMVYSNLDCILSNQMTLQC